MIKAALKSWPQDHSQNLSGKELFLKDRISKLDGKGENSLLSATGMEELHGLFEKLFSLSRINTSICWQQSRLQWLIEGDANSKYFH
jgi:hypothetical protein